MYICKDCGYIFEEGEEVETTERHGFNYGPFEEFSGCPSCGGAYEEIEPCKICGSYEHDADEEYCDDCKNSVKKRILKFIEEEFSTEEIELLIELFEDGMI